jgi:hypothetical protein
MVASARIMRFGGRVKWSNEKLDENFGRNLNSFIIRYIDIGIGIDQDTILAALSGGEPPASTLAVDFRPDQFPFLYDASFPFLAVYTPRWQKYLSALAPSRPGADQLSYGCFGVHTDLRRRY